MDCARNVTNRDENLPEKGVSAEKFYGVPTLRQLKVEAALKKQPLTCDKKLPTFMTDLLGPSRTWKIFRKQQDAIDCALNRRNGLMCFTFEQSDGVRLFLTAHPKVFWFIYSTRPPRERHSYEIIREHVACKLYLDLEYETTFNPDCNGNEILLNFLKIINIKLKECFNLDCSLNDVLLLDSSNPSKFSYHAVYQLNNHVFMDNYSVGNFVKMVCKEITNPLLAGCEEEIIKLSQKFDLTTQELKNLLIKDKTGKLKLFCDEGVYTKNRHFRLIFSSKYNKNTALVISDLNRYVQPKTEMDLFLDSLVTYVSTDLKVIEYESLKRESLMKSIYSKSNYVIECTNHSYPKLDAFVREIIAPMGKIRRKTCFSNSSTYVYEIQGYRFCENIGRAHKSNNIKLIIDLNNLTWFQKCYDIDCQNFQSPSKLLPDEIQFVFDTNNIDDLLTIDELNLNIDFWNMLDDAEKINTIPDFGLTDSEMMEVVEKLK